MGPFYWGGPKKLWVQLLIFYFWGPKKIGGSNYFIFGSKKNSGSNFLFFGWAVQFILWSKKIVVEKKLGSIFYILCGVQFFKFYLVQNNFGSNFFFFWGGVQNKIGSKKMWSNSLGVLKKMGSNCFGGYKTIGGPILFLGVQNN